MEDSEPDLLTGTQVFSFLIRANSSNSKFDFYYGKKFLLYNETLRIE